MLRIICYTICIILMLIFDGILIYLGITNKVDKKDIEYREFMKTKLSYFKLGQHIMLDDDKSKNFDDVVKNVKDSGVWEVERDEKEDE